MALLVMSQCRTAAARVTLLNKRSVLSVGTGENNLTLESQTKKKKNSHVFIRRFRKIMVERNY